MTELTRPTLRLRPPVLWQHSPDMPASVLLEPVLRWYTQHARPLPWRQRNAGAWRILVSEVMLQQTPVARVLPVYDAWVRRWPTPAGLASDAPGEALRMWGGLGYPRRALRLHETATILVRDYGSRVPSRYQQLLTLPGIGDYTAAAIAAFAYRERTVVLDTNVRRVLSRVVSGQERPPRAVQAAERRLAQELLPEAGSTAAAWNVAVMELGATVCTARAPRCAACPVSGSCAWRRAGFPTTCAARARVQRYEGTDRQARGRILALLRGTGDAVPIESLASVWPDPVQRERALRSLLDDGLVVEQAEGALALPGRRSER
jgi:A/G-specific adenine glycosylase